MVREYCHEIVCSSRLAYLAVEGKTFTKEKEIKYEITVIRNNGTTYRIRRSTHEIEKFRKVVKKFATDKSFRDVIAIQDKMKKVLVKENTSAQLKKFEKILNQLLSFDEIIQIASRFVAPEDWLCEQCLESQKDGEGKSTRDKDFKFDNTIVISEPFHYPKYKVTRNDGLPGNLNQPKPQVDDIVEVFQKNQTGWWYVLYKKKIICYPRSYLKSLDPASETENESPLLKTPQLYVARKSYTATKDDEISFNEGDIVGVLQMKYTGWWLVEIDDKSGFAPAIFLEKVTSKKTDEGLNLGFSPDEVTHMTKF